MKGSGKPDDRKGQVRFDAAGAGNGFTVELVRHRQTKETEQIGFTYGTPRQSSTLHLFSSDKRMLHQLVPLGVLFSASPTPYFRQCRLFLILRQ